MISSAEARDLLTDVDVVDTGGTAPVVALAHGAAGGVRENFAPVLEAGRLHRRVPTTLAAVGRHATSRP